MTGLAELQRRDVVRFRLRDGTTVRGSYETIVGMHYLSVPPLGWAMPTMLGPFTEADIEAIEVIKDRATVQEEAEFALLGEPVPGRDPVTRDDFQNRLELLARLASATHGDTSRLAQIRRQFDQLADRISLAKPKRQWMLNEARFRLRSNEEPTMATLWVDDCASPSCLARPRPQDFSPDASVRRARVPVPAEALADPRSVPNMLRALRAADLNPIVSRLGDPACWRAQLLVKMPNRGRSQFVADGKRVGVQMLWRLLWDGNSSLAGLRRLRVAESTETYERLVRVIGPQATRQDMLA